MEKHQVQGAQGSLAGRRQPREDGSHRSQSGSQIGRRACQVSKGQRKFFRMETCGHARCPTKPDRALLKHLEYRKTYQAKAMMARS